jgi:hypothetical protein
MRDLAAVSFTKLVDVENLPIKDHFEKRTVMDLLTAQQEFEITDVIVYGDNTFDPDLIGVATRGTSHYTVQASLKIFRDTTHLAQDTRSKDIQIREGSITRSLLIDCTLPSRGIAVEFDFTKLADHELFVFIDKESLSTLIGDNEVTEKLVELLVSDERVVRLSTSLTPTAISLVVAMKKTI